MPKLEERPDAGWLKRSIETGTAFVENHQDWAKAMKGNWLDAELHDAAEQPEEDDELEGGDPSLR